MTVVYRMMRFRALFPIFVAASVFAVLPADGKQLTSAQIKVLPECSLAKTNLSCKLVIDRNKPVAPSTIQMYSGQSVTVVVKNPFPYERYFLDYQTGQAAVSPDVGAAIVQGLIPPLAKLEIQIQRSLIKPPQPPPPDPCAAPEIIGPNLPKPNEVAGVLPAFQECLAKLDDDAISIYRSLEPFVASDSLTPNGVQTPGDPSALQKPIEAFLGSEFAMSGRITAISGKLNDPADQPAITQLTDLQKLSDAVADDLLGYKQRIGDLQLYPNESQDCANLIDLTAQKAQSKIQCVAITSRRDQLHVYQNMVTRTITYSLDALNLIAYSQQAVPAAANKRALATVAINFADAPTTKIGYPYTALRWEVSAGVLFSMLPIRSFSVAPTFTGTTITDNTVAQNIVRPTVVPFAAANYRLTNDLKWTRWKSDLYWTGAIGINPNTVSADFATGPTLSWRSLMFSAFCHFGHDVRLTQGFYNKEDLGASFTATLPTKNYWTESFAFGVSVRIPPLSGR